MKRAAAAAAGAATLMALAAPPHVGAQVGAEAGARPRAEAGAASAPEGPVHVEVLGVEGDLRRNVIQTLSLAAAGRSVMTDVRVRQLHARAPREIDLALQAFGHYEARVEGALAFQGDRWVARYVVDSGPAVRISSLEIGIVGEGEADPAFQGALERNRLQVGDPLHHARYAALKTALEGAAAERGYLDAAFDSSVIRVDRRRRSADIVLRFRTGPRFAFGPVTFLQDVVDPAILEAVVPFEVGDPFDATELLALQDVLREAAYFTSVEVVPRRDRAEGLAVPVEVHLVPHPSRRYFAGLGYGTDTGARVTANLEARRLTQGGHRVEVEGRLSFLDRRVSGRYFIPLPHRHASMLTLSTGFDDANPTTSDTETYFAGVNLSGVLGGWRGDVSFTLEKANFEVGPDSGISTLLILGAGLSRVRADDRIFPTRGSLVGLRGRVSHDAFISDTHFVQVGIETKLVRSLIPGTRLLARAEAGAVFTSRFRQLPGPHRYFAGGDRSVRGFAYRSLGPMDEAGEVVGGERLLTGSLELDRRVLDRWGVAAFVDVGNALTSVNDGLQAGAGVGLRWRSPIGPIRLDGAFAVSRSGAPFRLHLTLGPEL